MGSNCGSDHRGVLRVQPDVIEQLGDVGYLHGMASDGTEVVVQVQDRLSVTPSTELRLAFDPSRAFLFDTNGQRIR